MVKRIVATLALLLCSAAGTCQAGCSSRTPPLSPPCKKNIQADPVEKVLKQLKQRTEALESYQARIEYLFKQPLPGFESRTLRKGVLYYQKFGEKSKLRMNFKTLKQDDEKEQKYVEQFIFDGIWLADIDYQIKHVTKRQLAEPNEPVDAFELVKRNFPIIGFTKVEELKKEFEIKLIEQAATKPPPFIQLRLKVKPDSTYKDDYTSIDFWIDKKLGLPAKIIAVSTEEDIYQIKMLKPKVNKKVKSGVFDFKIPKGFTVDTTPLKKTEKEKDSLRRNTEQK